MYKSVSLNTRKPINSDMPWWSLPEIIRAAAYIYPLSAGQEKKDFFFILKGSLNVIL